jgi:hypothetical protein
MITIRYPKNRLVHWGNESQSVLKNAVCNYCEEIATSDDIWLIRDYLKHWIEFDGHQFEDESDREFLASKAERCKTSSDIDNLVKTLVHEFGIDPL